MQVIFPHQSHASDEDNKYKAPQFGHLPISTTRKGISSVVVKRVFIKVRHFSVCWTYCAKTESLGARGALQGGVLANLSSNAKSAASNAQH